MKIVIGSRVEVRTSHGGYYGKKGVVVKMSRFYYDIHLENEDLIIKRAKKNVILV